MSNKIEDLIAHLKQHKDAVLIVGPYAVENYGLFEITDACKDEFNRKNMVKEPEKFWNWYRENVYKGRLDELDNQNLKAIMDLYCKDVVSKIISVSQEGVLNDIAGISDDVINLMGSQRFVQCVKCHSTYALSKNHRIELEPCEHCGSRLRPTVLMPGEALPFQEYLDTKKAIFNEEDDEVKLNTHTLICIGVDFDQPSINEIVQNYKSLMNKRERNYLVLINEKDSLSIELLEPEFATQNDIAGSINRLVKMIEEE